VKFAHVTPEKHACDHMIFDELATRHFDVIVTNGIEVASRPVLTGFRIPSIVLDACELSLSDPVCVTTPLAPVVG
jgi:hypothetical protein